MARAVAVAAALVALSGCAVPRDSSEGQAWGRARLQLEDGGGGLRRCTEAFAAIDDAVERAATGDAQAAPIPGFPHLRTTRFLAALGARFLGPRTAANDDAAFDSWTGWLADTATAARGFELANLSPPALAALRRKLAGNRPQAVVEECRAILASFDRRRPEARAILARTVNVPDNYNDILRVVGIYPLTAIPVLIGFELWQRRNLPSFAGAAPEARTGAAVERYAPAAHTAPMTAAAVAALLRRSADNPLRIPRPSAEALRRLAATFAPVFAVGQTGDHDRIGTPMVTTGAAPGLDTGAPRVYVQPSWAIFDGVPLLQISYLAWFSERPPVGDMDILAGRMDGVMWRVTIGADGRPMLYDSIHPCGCYHLFFPRPPTRLRLRPIDDPGEGTVVPTDAPALGPGQRMVLHIGGGDHYLRALSVAAVDAAAATRYELAAMDDLRSLPLPAGGTRSLYDGRGMVAGTERRERFLLWPMGIASPGAMRQWGTHATAFVGRRHFDDPYLIDKAFTR